MKSLLVESFLRAFDHLGVPRPYVYDEHPSESYVMMKWETELIAEDLVDAIGAAFPLVNHDFNKNLNGFKVDQVLVNDGTVLITFEVN